MATRRFTSRTRGVAAAAGLALAVLLAGCGKQAAAMPAMTEGPSAATASAAATPVAATAVSIKDFAFSPPVIQVPLGATVTWTNNDIEEHTVTARDKSFDSDVVASTKSFTFTFNKAGTYDYYCMIHPNMVGKVVVTP